MLFRSDEASGGDAENAVQVPSYARFRERLLATRQSLMRKHGFEDVRFEAYRAPGGKVSLKALPQGPRRLASTEMAA